MPAGGAAKNVQQELTDSIARIARLPAGRITDDTVPAFNDLRKAVVHASSSHKDSLEEVLGPLEPKDTILTFLVAVYDAKRIYRKQIAAVLTILVQAGSWKSVLLDNESLHASLPEDVRKIVLGEEAAQAAPASTPEQAVPAAAPTTAGPLAQEAAQEALQQAAPVAAPAAAPAAAEPQARAEPQRERELKPQELQAIGRELEESMRRIALLPPHGDKAEAFGALRRPVQKASCAPKAQLHDLLEDLEPKGAAFVLLVDLHEQSKKHRKQIEGVFEVLLKDVSWLRELRAGALVASRLPAELKAIAEARGDDPQEQSQADVDNESLECGASAQHLGLDTGQAGAAAGSKQAHDTDSAASTSPTASPSTRAKAPPHVSKEDVREAVAAARQRLSRTPTRQAEKLPKDARQALRDAHQQIQMLISKHGAEVPTTAAASDDAIDVFENFRRAVAHAVGSFTVEAGAALDQLEPKRPIIEFLIELNKTKPKYQSRIVGTFQYLMGCLSWKEAAEADEELSAAVNAILERQYDLVKLGDGSAISLKKKAKEVIASGGVGVLCVHVLAARSLVNTKAFGRSSPYVRVTVCGKTRQTPVASDDLHPVWKVPPYIFEVPTLDAQVQFEVLDRSGNDAETPMGRLELRVARPRDELGQGPQRQPFCDVEHGELEFDLRYEGEVQQDAPRFSVSGMLEQAIAMLTGDANNGEPVEIFDSELRCPSMHPITKRKEGLRWHQVLTKAEQRCNLCDDPISPTASRWRCHFHCDFDVCEACYVEVHGGLVSVTRSRTGDIGQADVVASSSSRGSRLGRRPSSTGATVRAKPKMSASSSAGSGSQRSSSASRLAHSLKEHTAHTVSLARSGMRSPRFLQTSTPHPDSYCSSVRELTALDVASASVPADGIEHRAAENTVFYAVDVEPEPGGEPWRVMRRYNDFGNLADRLGTHAKSFPDAPFPGKQVFGMTGPKLEERRRGLELWLRRVLARRPLPKVWVRPLHEFCHAGPSGEARSRPGFAPPARGPAGAAAA